MVKNVEVDMSGYQVFPFQHEGKEYEIRVTSDGITVQIRIFLDGVPANGYVYQVNSTTAFDLKKIIGMDAITYLIDMAKEDVKQQRWENFLEALDRTR